MSNQSAQPPGGPVARARWFKIAHELTTLAQGVQAGTVDQQEAVERVGLVCCREALACCGMRCVSSPDELSPRLQSSGSF